MFCTPKKTKTKFIINWFIYTLNLLVTFSAALSLFHTQDEIHMKYLYPITIIIGFINASVSKKNISIIFCKLIFYIFLILFSLYMPKTKLRTGDELITSLILCSSDIALIIMEYARIQTEKLVKHALKQRLTVYGMEEEL